MVHGLYCRFVLCSIGACLALSGCMTFNVPPNAIKEVKEAVESDARFAALESRIQSLEQNLAALTETMNARGLAAPRPQAKKSASQNAITSAQ